MPKKKKKKIIHKQLPPKKKKKLGFFFHLLSTQFKIMPWLFSAVYCLFQNTTDSARQAQGRIWCSLLLGFEACPGPVASSPGGKPISKASRSFASVVRMFSIGRADDRCIRDRSGLATCPWAGLVRGEEGKQKERFEASTVVKNAWTYQRRRAQKHYYPVRL